MRGQKLNIFNALAHALAEQGIASLRYDKRGCGKSSGVFIKAGHADFVQDAVQCLDTLATLENVSANSLFILRHSEGSIIAPQVSHHRPTVAGLILLCPFIERLESILIRQAAQLEKEVDSLPGIAGTYYRSLFRIIGKPRATQQRLLRKARDTGFGCCSRCAVPASGEMATGDVEAGYRRYLCSNSRADVTSSRRERPAV